MAVWHCTVLADGHEVCFSFHVRDWCVVQRGNSSKQLMSQTLTQKLLFQMPLSRDAWWCDGRTGAYIMDMRGQSLEPASKQYLPTTGICRFHIIYVAQLANSCTLAA